MSRELLQRAFNALDKRNVLTDEEKDLLGDIEAHLAKPLPKPVAYAALDKSTGKAAFWSSRKENVELYIDDKDGFYLSAIYAEPPEQKPLSDHTESYSDALRSLASYVGCGGYNTDDPIDAKVFEDKIRYGIDLLIAAQSRNSESTALTDTERSKLEEEIKQLKSDNKNLTERNALLRQRPDLPVDRIPAHKRLVELQAAMKPLSDGEIIDMYFDGFSIGELLGFAMAIERAHGITDPEQSKPQSNAI